MTSIGLHPSALHASALEFKKVMSAALDRALEDDPQLSKKLVAMELGVTQSDLSHWLSDKTRFTMPGHLIPAFCCLVGDNSLLWHLQVNYELPTNNKAGTRLPA